MTPILRFLIAIGWVKGEAGHLTPILQTPVSGHEFLILIIACLYSLT